MRKPIVPLAALLIMIHQPAPAQLSQDHPELIRALSLNKERIMEVHFSPDLEAKLEQMARAPAAGAMSW